jgi:hypothetical protein
MLKSIAALAFFAKTTMRPSSERKRMVEINRTLLTPTQNGEVR